MTFRRGGVQKERLRVDGYYFLPEKYSLIVPPVALKAACPHLAAVGNVSADIAELSEKCSAAASGNRNSDARVRKGVLPDILRFSAYRSKLRESPIFEFPMFSVI